jgi:leader peptidase (prepilin peptidase)/N-methyltransferase
MAQSIFYFWSVSTFLIGAAVGSFLNVVILRIPLNESLVAPGSHCPECGTGIRPYDNIPILSYLILWGRCRDCRSSISSRYPIIELITALLAMGLFWRWGLTWTFVVFFLFSAAMVAVFFIDFDHLIIPDSISLNGIPIGFAASILGAIPWMDWRLSLLGFIIGGAILYIPALMYEYIRGMEGLGAGDVKLLAMMGAFVGPMGVFFILFLSSLAGSLVGVVSMVAGRTGATSPIPFGPFLAAAGVLYVFLGGGAVDRFLVQTIRSIMGS